MSNAIIRSQQAATAEEWYYAYDNNRGGPFSLNELEQLIAIGHLPPQSKVWRREDPKWQTADSTVPSAGNHRSPIQGFVIKEARPFDPWIDKMSDPVLCENLRRETAERQRRAFALFSSRLSCSGLTRAVNEDSGVRAWLHGHAEACFDLICAVYFPSLILPPQRTREGISVFLQDAACEEVLWPTEANFHEPTRLFTRGMEALYGYLSPVNLKDRGWLENNSPDLFNLARLAVAHRPDRCDVCRGEFEYPRQYEEDGKAMVEGEPLDQCQKHADPSDHCVACCPRRRRQHRWWCDKCDRRVPEDNLCSVCGHCRRCCKCPRCRQCRMRPAKCRTDGCGYYDAIHEWD